MKPSDILIRAKEKISDRDHWIRGCSALNAMFRPVGSSDPQARYWCASGAVTSVLGADYNFALDGPSLALTYLDDAAGEMGASGIVFLNDTRFHEDVMEAFDRAIEKAKLHEDTDLKKIMEGDQNVGR